MQLASFVLLSGLVALVSAHFQLQFPVPRGPFVEDDEPTFCDGFTNAVSNRTVFPLSNGTISLNSEHPVWTLTVLLSTLANPQSFGNFSQAVPFFQVTGEGAFCFPVDFAAANLPGVQDGSNVTIQLEFDGGDGKLFQCADLTLSNAATVPGSVSCINATGDTVQTLSSSNAIPTSTSPASSSSAGSSGGASSSTTGAPAQTSSPSAALNLQAAGFSGLLGVVAFVLAAL